MKSLISIVVTILVCSHVMAQLQENNLKELKLKGKVRSLAEISYSAIDKEGPAEKAEATGAFIIDFNVSGNMTRKRYFQANEIMYEKDTCLYDSEGRMIEKDVYDRWGKLEPGYTYKYDSNQKMVERSSYDADGSYYGRSVYKYNKYRRSMNVIDEFFYDKDGGRNGGKTFQYDSLGNLTNDATYSYRYDSNGNMIEKTSNSMIATYTYTFQYEYDKNLNWIKRTEVINGRMPYRIIERLIAYY